MAAPKRKQITLECTECKNRCYSTEKNSTSNPERIEIKKFCRFCNKRTVHKETK
ncbi:MAG: 50S ribosomal protein L33 [Clostridia bacterium]|nr:50S ribosomal protein L33 [Clostridia bacterium]